MKLCSLPDGDHGSAVVHGSKLFRKAAEESGFIHSAATWVHPLSATVRHFSALMLSISDSKVLEHIPLLMPLSQHGIETCPKMDYAAVYPSPNNQYVC